MKTNNPPTAVIVANVVGVATFFSSTLIVEPIGTSCESIQLVKSLIASGFIYSSSSDCSYGATGAAMATPKRVLR